MAHLEEKTISSEQKFDGRIVKLYVDKAELEDGKIVTREVIRHPGGVCVLPLTDKNEVMFVKQFRYPHQTVLLEIPAGKLDSKDEDPRKAAARELLEETGAVAEELIELGMFLPACAYSDEAIHMYAAKSLTFREQKLDADEFLNVFTMPLEQAVQKVLAGEIWDAKTQTALLKVWLLRQQGRL